MITVRRPRPSPVALPLLLLVGCLTVAVSSREQAVAPFAITHGPYLQLPTTTSMTIVWHTTGAGVSHVEAGREKAGNEA